MSRCGLSDATLIAFWDVMYEDLHKLSNVDDYVSFNDASVARACFLENYQKLENVVATKYMQTQIDGLDRHKQTAILIISAIESKPITTKASSAVDNIFAWQTVVVACGLSYMLRQLNIALQSKGYKGNEIKEYSFPVAFSCATDYLMILGRNLWYTKELNGWEINPIDLANTLFLIEYITLLENNVDKSLLKEC